MGWTCRKEYLSEDGRDVAGNSTPGTAGSTHDELIKQGFQASRLSLRTVQGRLGVLEQAISDADRLDGNAKIIAIASLGRNFSRDIAVLSDKLRTSPDPLSSQFRDALQKTLRLIKRNLDAESSIIDGGSTGRCTPPPGKGVPFGATRVTDPDPRVSVCAPTFPMNKDMHRDVITHEFFHLVGLHDTDPIANTADALDDANTMAQVVAYVHDRTRREDSSGLSRPSVVYPSP